MLHFFKIFIFSFLFSGASCAFCVNQDIEIVSIDIENAGNDLRMAKNEGLQIAKRRIFNEIVFKMKVDNNSYFNDLEIDSCIESFQLSNETFDNNEYKASLKVAINKNILKQIAESKNRKEESVSMKKNVSIDILSNDISLTWNQMRRYIQNRKIDIKKLSFGKNRVIIDVNKIDLSDFKENMSNIAKDSIIKDAEYE